MNSEYAKNQQKEVDSNYAIFKKLLAEDKSILQNHYGQHALMKGGEILGYYSTMSDAVNSGNLAFGKEAVFSVQEITNEVVDLGYFSYAFV